MANEKRLEDLCDGVRVVMLTTQVGGALRSRPLTVQEVAGDTIWFLVAADTDWLPELDGGPVQVVIQGDQVYAAVSGSARTTSDPQVLDELGDPVSDTWFNEHEPLALRVDVREGDWWTTPGLVRAALQVVKAKVTDDAPDLGERGTVAGTT
jgi:general stress protein 26